MLPLVLSATAAAATAVAVNAPPPPADFDAPPKLRNGIVLGLSLGSGLFGASGYPNEASRIGDPNYHEASGLMIGNASTLLIMGAISDYMNFGFWFGGNASENDHWKASAGGGGVRVEVFPFVHLSPQFGLDGVAFFGQFGIGGASLTSKDPATPQAGGVQSFVGSGAFWEFPFGHVLGGHFAVAPSLEYDAVWSQPFERHGAVFAVRVVFYGGP